jgi:translocator protein
MSALLSDTGWTIGVAAVWTLALMIVGGLLTEVGPWYEHLNFPSLRPPNWLFAPAWTVIFTLTAAAGVVAWEHASPNVRPVLIAAFAVNSLLNLLWSPLFFKLKRPDWALYELIPFWLSIAALLWIVAQISALSGWLMVPYLAWVTFAGWLNWRMVELNKPFGSRAAEAGARGDPHGRSAL